MHRIDIGALDASSVSGLTREAAIAYLPAEPVLLVSGHAAVAVETRLKGDRFVIELTSGERADGVVLAALWALGNHVARVSGAVVADWIVHALNRTNPNLAMRQFVKEHGLAITPIDDDLLAYRVEVPLVTTKVAA
ncbi:hypothetical protein ACRC7T_00140 [Segnochrobactraceae bacterium EtOH-i3]